MKIKVPYLIQDPRIGQAKGLKPVEMRTFERESFCLDGPITRRIAVLDFDEDTGQLNAGIPFLPPSEDRDFGIYALADDQDFRANDFLPVNVFTTVLGTLYMYEEADVLGREVRWAFGSPQLFVIPRAGEWANAFYQRESNSIQFFHFPSRYEEVYTALSQEIISHETGHAILDGIAPDLYNCLTPQSLALHEGVADLTALLVALRSRELRSRLLDQTNGSISGKNAYTQLAEQFGFARDHTHRASALRSLWNERNLNPDDETLDDLNQPNSVSRTEPHLLSEVLSGALYRVFARLHEEYKSFRAADQGISEKSASGWALYVAREHFKRLVLRSLDYLPPGEVSFADYGRAILGSDEASYKDQSTGRDFLVNEFVRRHIVATPEELYVQTNYDHPAVRDLDLEILLTSDWAAYDFANDARDFLGIPQDVHFRVRPRLRAKKRYWTTEGPTDVEELIFKVSWDREEDNPPNLSLPVKRQITVGTTLILDWETKKVRILLKSEATVPADGSRAIMSAADQQRQDRDNMLRDFVLTHQLGFGPDTDDTPLFEKSARIEVSGDLMRVRGSGRMLHIAAQEEE